MSTIFKNTPTNRDFNNPTGNEIAIIAGTPTYNAAEIDSQLCIYIKEAEFNAVAGSIVVSSIINSFTNCLNAGLKLFLYNGTLIDANNQTAFVNRYKEFPSLGGWLLNYDPGFPGFTDYERLLSSYKAITDADPVHPVYIALPAEWDSENIKSFPDYIATFQSDFQPSFWPFVYFPDISAQGISREERVMTFYKNLQYFAYISRFTARPFWGYCRCQGFDSIDGATAATPTLSNMRRVVFSSLAYGAQGIYYWNFRQTYGNKYHDGPMDSHGNLTNTWKYVQTINKEVKALNDIFFGCELIECRQLTTFQDTKWFRLMTNPFGPLINVESIDGITPNILISHIFNNGADYLVVVNFPNEDGSNENLRFYFSEYYKIYTISLLANSYYEIEQTNNVYIPLKAADYYIFKWV